MVCCIAAILTPLDAQSLEAQAEVGNQELGRLVGGTLRVQLSVRGIDSTQWFHGRVMRTTTGCTHIQVLNGRWVDGQLLPDSTPVPPVQRISAPLRSLHRIQTTPHGLVPDSVSAWTDVPLDTLLMGEPAACEPDR